MLKPFLLVRIALLLLVTALSIVAAPSDAAAKNLQQSQSRAAPLTNQDVIVLWQAKLTPDEMIAKIRSSPANFDTSEAGLRALAESGLPAAVIAVMVQAEQPRSSNPAKAVQEEQPAQIIVPAGTQLDVEAAYTVDSLHVHAGDLISFRVLVPIKINGITVIDKGSLVTARVVAARRGGHWGRAGRLAWTMQDVVAVDGTRLPMRPADESGSDKLSKANGNSKRSESPGSSNSVKGTSHGAEVATKIIIAGALFPPLAPLGLIQGFRRGENAVLPEGKRFLAFVGSDARVTVNAKR
jgi:hypothetical protein